MNNVTRKELEKEDDHFIHVLEISFVSGLFALLFFILTAIFHSSVLAILGLISLGVFALVWGGTVLLDFIQNAISSKNIIGALAYLGFIALIIISIYKN